MANPSLQIGNGKFAIKENDLLGYSSSGTRFFPIPITMTRATLGTRVNPSGLIENVELSGTVTNLARVDYTDGTGSLLVEPQRTNLITYSEDLSVLSKVSVGTASAPVTTSNYATAPDGTQTATRVVFDLNGGTSSGDRSILRQAIPSGSNYYFSIYVKSTDGTEQNILWHDGGEYNLTTVTNEWVRITYDGRPNLVFSGIALRGGDGVDSSDILAWGFQVEEGSYPTSYIKTQGSSVTRNADQYTKTGISDKINSEEGVLFAEMASLIDDGTSRLIGLSDGTSTKRINIYYDTSSNSIYGLLLNSSVQGITSFTLSDSTNFAKIAFKYKENDFALWVNGTEVDTDSSGTTFTSDTLNKLSFDRADGVAPFFGKVKQLQVFKTALSDSELATLTT